MRSTDVQVSRESIEPASVPPFDLLAMRRNRVDENEAAVVRDRVRDVERVLG
jgi:hypothetical protein